ncbi:hypothetical protein GRAN_2053 [Granulicella sibirica]|uniref:Uncharacterized protein n=1 Tax=Granulicella sibirica TaxID=2479048 RepID=A0A4Q0T4X6_9BACT|nr:hypothetical protein GRAN_2053 [Granulicella sibirica]
MRLSAKAGHPARRPTTRQTQIPYGNDNQNGKDSGLAAPTLVDDEAVGEGGAPRLDGQ